MKGYVLEYEPKDNNSRTLLNYTLFGRIVSRNYRGRKYHYYRPGMLHETKYARLLPSKIFVTDLENIDLEELEIFGRISVEEAERDEDMILLITGQEHWEKIAREKGITLKYGKK